MNVSVYIATSLDGFIAREDDSLDWLDAASENVPDGDDCGYLSFMESIDVLVMGHITFEKVMSFGKWPYGDKPVIVLSSKQLDVPDEMTDTVSHSSESPADLYERLSEDGIQRIYIDGGVTIQRFLEAGLVNDITITVIPVVLGSGKSLFGKLEEDIALSHVSTKVFDFGFVQSCYEIQCS